MSAESNSIHFFAKQIWIVCPNCHAKAIATADQLIRSSCGLRKPRPYQATRGISICTHCRAKLFLVSIKDEANNFLICSSCDYIHPTSCGRCGQQLKEMVALDERSDTLNIRCPKCQYVNFRGVVWLTGISGNPYDPYFGEPLWLQASCCGHVLWAYNSEHLTFLKNYVVAQLRVGSTVNNSLISRLPAWIKEAKHRKRILKAIEKLENKK